MLREYAWALLGMLQEPCGIGTLRVAPAAMEGPPKVPAGPRVSMMRQGVTGTKRYPVVTVVKDHTAEGVDPKEFTAVTDQ
jgi:hypothetical protein